MGALTDSLVVWAETSKIITLADIALEVTFVNESPTTTAVVLAGTV
jgi:hypothetical protein